MLQKPEGLELRQLVIGNTDRESSLGRWVKKIVNFIKNKYKCNRKSSIIHLHIILIIKSICHTTILCIALHIFTSGANNEGTGKVTCTPREWDSATGR